jgi:hypothetical protein
MVSACCPSHIATASSEFFVFAINIFLLLIYFCSSNSASTRSAADVHRSSCCMILLGTEMSCHNDKEWQQVCNVRDSIMTTITHSVGCLPSPRRSEELAKSHANKLFGWQSRIPNNRMEWTRNHQHAGPCSVGSHPSARSLTDTSIHCTSIWESLGHSHSPLHPPLS